MTEIQVEVKQEDLETLVNSEPIMRMRLQNIALQRTVEEQASEIRRLNEQISGMEGEGDAESG
jgi:hypothetical protein